MKKFKVTLQFEGTDNSEPKDVKVWLLKRLSEIKKLKISVIKCGKVGGN